MRVDAGLDRAPDASPLRSFEDEVAAKAQISRWVVAQVETSADLRSWRTWSSMKQLSRALALVAVGALLAACSFASPEETEDETPSGSGGDSPAGSGGSDAGSGGATGSGGTVASAFCDESAPEDALVSQPEPYVLPSEATPVSDAPVGSLSTLENYSSVIYDDVFPYRIYVSPAYDELSPAALMVFQDGSLYVDMFKAAVVLDNLTHSGDVPPLVALFIDTPPGGEPRRVEVYDDPSDQYTRFLVDEIIPDVIESAYHITDDPDGRATVGFSAGGTQAFAPLLYRSEEFHKSLGHNSSFLAAKANGVDFSLLVASLPSSLHLKVSLLSSENDLSDHRGDWLDGNRAMAAALRTGGHDVRMVEGTGGHYPPEQAVADFPSGVRWLWSNCQSP